MAGCCVSGDDCGFSARSGLCTVEQLVSFHNKQIKDTDLAVYERCRASDIVQPCLLTPKSAYGNSAGTRQRPRQMLKLKTSFQNFAQLCTNTFAWRKSR